MARTSQRQDHGDPDLLERRMLAVCDATGVFIEHWGFKEIHGRVWTLLALRREPTSQALLARTLGVSRSSISGAISDLEGLGLVRATSDHRHAPYEPVLDVWPIIADVLRNREWMLLERARIALEAATQALESAPEDDTRFDTERLRFLLGMTQMGQVVLQFLIALRLPTSTSDVGGWLHRGQDAVNRLKSRLETFSGMLRRE